MIHTIPVFVYGSLRVGEAHYQWAHKCVIDTRLNATTPGHVWFAYQGGYPVAKFSPGSPDLIHGDVLWCYQESPIYGRVLDMEIGAGYVPMDIEVTMDDGKVMDAIGFHYLGTPQPHLFIVNGDWRKTLAQEGVRF